MVRGGACCVWCLVSAIHILDNNDMLLTRSVSKEVKHLLDQFLIHWQGLWQESVARGLKRWKMRPKHHYVEELGIWTVQNEVNIRFAQCFMDESFLGYLKRVATKCDSVTVLKRVYQRLFLNWAERWHETRRHAQHARGS